MATYIKPGIYTQEIDTNLYYNGEKAIETTKDGYRIYWDKGSRAASSTSASYAASSTSDNQVAVEQSLQVYADLLAERLEQGNLDEVDKNTIAGMIYGVLMKEDYPEYVRDGLLKDCPDKDEFLEEEDVLI